MSERKRGIPREGYELVKAEMFRCGKKNCLKCADGKAGHGPYLKAYIRGEHGRLTSRYIGKPKGELPPQE